MNEEEFSEFKGTIDLYSTQYNATDKVWNYFMTTTLAIIGYALESKHALRSLGGAIIVVFGYIVFCFGNYNALMLSHRQLIEFADLVKPMAENHKVTLTTLTPLSTRVIKTFYLSVVVLVCIGIFYISWQTHQKSHGLK